MTWTLPHAHHTPALHLRALLRRCARTSSPRTATQLHAAALVSGLLPPTSSDPHSLLNALFHLYSLSSLSLSHAIHLFHQIPNSHKDSVDYTALISATNPNHALRLFSEMRSLALPLDPVSVLCVLTKCSHLGCVKTGSQLHALVVKLGVSGCVRVCNALMDVYVKCGLVDGVRRVFEDMGLKSVVSWTVVLEGVVKGEGLENGRKVFDEMPERNEVAWTVMIVGYVENGMTREAFELLREMIFGCGFVLNGVSLCSILSACSRSGDVSLGRWVHGYAVKEIGWDVGVMVGTGLVDMYAKCGRIGAALVVFRNMPRRNVVAWNAMIGGLAMHGKGKDVVDMFDSMIGEGVSPDGLTFLALLSACSHSGMVDLGWKYFNELESIHGINPEMEHYACMVDLLGRAGRLEEAEAFIKSMPFAPNEVVLGSLFGSCYTHGKVKLGEQIMRELVQMDPYNTEYHVLLSNMYALSGKEEKANFFRKVLKKRGIKKVPGTSSMYVGGQLHQFIAGDKSHPQTAGIYMMLDDMIRRLRLGGYVPNTSSQVLFGCSTRDDCTEALEEVEQVLFTHSEKLALAFGLTSTPSGSPIHIFKNLRICQDCHSAMKIASYVYNREIVVRDRYRFHSFKQGSCSCSDYW
ncbi:pentatricopeptide repeat-containing protein At5g15340, mitochondrial [Arachis hypogaea]|nr:pentatricopeptide repeat-containing protein At5g15340, mitochondrial [Arachis hypogaea]QHN83615.1 Pentatricopeptide repeat-containing protein [Arachis hypogaea]